MNREQAEKLALNVWPVTFYPDGRPSPARPERLTDAILSAYRKGRDDAYQRGWNACLDEIQKAKLEREERKRATTRKN